MGNPSERKTGLTRRAAPSPPADRLLDEIFEVFGHACELHELEVAAGLLAIIQGRLDRDASQASGGRPRLAQDFVDAHFRLFELRCRVRHDH